MREVDPRIERRHVRPVREDHEHAALLADQLAMLPEHYREVLVLRHLENLSFDEIGVHMERTPGATRMLWLRAIDELRKLLKARGMA